MKRFNDDGKRWNDFGDYRIVACPSCQKPVDHRGESLACIHCGYSKIPPVSDKLFYIIDVTNYLTIPCCGHELRAANSEHLDFLENYVGATLRERIPNKNRSVASRLPQWIKDKNNREEILKCIKKLRAKLEKEGYTPKNIL